MAHKAFVSSTFEDLREHRGHVIERLRSAGFAVDPMEDWTAAADEPKSFSRDRLDGCNLCVLLVAFRRGHVPEGEDYSITQLEYRAARERGIDVLVFLLDEKAPWLRTYDELDKDPELRRWRDELMERHGVGFFGLEAKSLDLTSALARWLSEKAHRSEAQADTTVALARYPELAALEIDCQQASTGKAMARLRELVAARLQALASAGGLDGSDMPPMHLLRRLAEAGSIPPAAHEGLEYSLAVTSEVLYDREVSRHEGVNAVHKAAAALHTLSESEPNGSTFQIERTRAGRYRFTFRIDGSVLLRSNSYTSQVAATMGIRAVRRVVESGSFGPRVAKSGQSYVQMIGANGEILATSALFDSDVAARDAIAAFTEHVPMAPVIDLSGESDRDG